MLFEYVWRLSTVVGLLAFIVGEAWADAVEAADAATLAESNGTGHHTRYLSPVRLNEACKDPTFYCVYLNQNYRAVVDITPFYASDNQGGFLFLRSLYLDSPDVKAPSGVTPKPISICYGGSCIGISFTAANGCVAMTFRGIPTVAKGHLLGHFADNTDLKIGPKPTMLKTLYACPSPQENLPTPYAVIEARYRKGMARSSELSSGSSPGFAITP